MEKTEWPRELLVPKKYHEFYENIKKGKILPELKGYDMAYLFIIAVAYGVYYKKEDKKIKGEGDAKRTVSFNAIAKFEPLLNAIAIKKYGTEVISDKAKIARTAENYAYNGIEIIKNLIEKSKPGEFEIDLEEEMVKILKNY